MSNPEAEAAQCPQCGTRLAPALLACPACGRLVHAAALKALSAEAEHADQARDSAAALASWRQALELLPPQSRQHAVITARIEELGKQAPPAAVPAAPSAGAAGAGPSKARAGGIAGLGALALVLWKFKFVAALVLTKGKFLLLGLTKASTFFSMFLSLGVYWAAWGWKFALGLVLSIYIHEMGHVAALRRYGIKASAPMFIPGVGAFVRLHQRPANPVEDARVGLAGPLWGLGAALATFAVYLATDWPSWLAITRVGAWINLFNLTPLWQLDGARGFRALTRAQRWLAVAGLGVAWFLTAEGLLALLLIVGIAAALSPSAATKPDRLGLAQYLFLVAALSLLCVLPAPVNGTP
jgi:Zn-dependent protease